MPDLTAKQREALERFAFASADGLDVHSAGIDLRTVLALWRKGLVFPDMWTPCRFLISVLGDELWRAANRKEAADA